MSLLFFLRVPTPHSQHGLEHLVGPESRLRSSICSHDAQLESQLVHSRYMYLIKAGSRGVGTWVESSDGC